jgi:hypothetical protein
VAGLVKRGNEMPDQEMTLKQYIEQLPKCHLARKQYESLAIDEKVLDSLRAAGVDNWEGYCDAMRNVELDVG